MCASIVPLFEGIVSSSSFNVGQDVIVSELLRTGLDADREYLGMMIADLRLDIQCRVQKHAVELWLIIWHEHACRGSASTMYLSAFPARVRLPRHQV
jgi:hypothetical protein